MLFNKLILNMPNVFTPSPKSRTKNALLSEYLTSLTDFQLNDT